MSIIVNVKDVNDFGKVSINPSVSQYQQTGKRPTKNDIMIYYYPKIGNSNGPSVGIYQVIAETKSEGQGTVYGYFQGTMRNLLGTRDAITVINDMIKFNKDLGTRIDNTIYDLQKKYNPEIFKNIIEETNLDITEI
jgi:hypothetical protein